MKNLRPLFIACLCVLVFAACQKDVDTHAALPPQNPSASPTPSPTPHPTKPRAPFPFAGELLIADRGNNRLILVDAAKHVTWFYPSQSRPVPPGGFYFPDDAFFTGHGTGIIANEEENHMIVRIAFPSGQITWTYGHARVAGSGPGYLDQPDDAYLLKNGIVTVADARNCRILFIDAAKHITNEIGHAGSCRHNPPYSIAYPNGDTPMRNGDVLVSEVNGSYVDEISPAGKLIWSVHLPLPYPSDPQQIGPDRYLVASYARPGGLLEFTHTGRILWRYRVTGGEGMLDHPSLAAMLPGGLICVNDDYRHRVVIIDPRTNKIVWQFGHTDKAGRTNGYLSIPDGFDLLAPDGSTPTHPFTG